MALSACGGIEEATPDRVSELACQAFTAAGTPYNPGTPGADGAPEIPTGFATKAKVASRSYMVIAANPLATRAGCEVLRAGGSAIDAAIATQMVLNVVEPQSSGIGGGAFMLHYDRARDRVTAYDGRETAPAAATENDLRWISDAQRTPPLPNPRASGRSIGTPGLLHMLDAAHRDGGRRPWRELFDPAIRIADDGFAISPRLAASIAANADALARDAESRAHFLNADGTPKAVGLRLRSAALARTFRAIADGGIAAFYGGAIAQGIVDEVTDTAAGTTPGVTTLADLAQYRSAKRESICSTYRIWWVCGMPPPSSGGLAVAQILGILESFDLALHRPVMPDANGGRPTAFGVHLVAEAQRLAYADRDRYVADTDFVPLPGGDATRMLDKTYLRQRSSLINQTRSMGAASAGDLGTLALGSAAPGTENGTSQVTVVDAQGNVVSLTTTIESAFGSFRMTRDGFLLNNQLTDFSAAPADANGNPIANRLAPGKRPRSSMAPTLVFRMRSDGGRGEFHLATGSPGGGAIIQYVSKVLVGALDWGLDAQQASALVNFGAANTPTTNVGGEHPSVNLANGGNDDGLIRGLRALGHTVGTAQQTSGIGTVIRRRWPGAAAALEGGADPRREGIALGDLYPPN
jgi:gamma-glutamyltranspeptidase/glutathione hydrolase